MNRFFDGSPAATLLKLAIASVCVGLLLSLTGLDPLDIWQDAWGTIGEIWQMGLDALVWSGKYLVMGAIIVLPIWVIVRLFDVLFRRSS